MAAMVWGVYREERRHIPHSRPPPAHTPLPAPSPLSHSCDPPAAHPRHAADTPAARLACNEARTARIGGGDEEAQRLSRKHYIIAGISNHESHIQDAYKHENSEVSSE